MVFTFFKETNIVTIAADVSAKARQPTIQELTFTYCATIEWDLATYSMWSSLDIDLANDKPVVEISGPFCSDI